MIQIVPLMMDTLRQDQVRLCVYKKSIKTLRIFLGPACQVRTTGYGYPDSCSDRLARSHKNILFLGNSFTYYHDLPGMVSSLASAAGKSASTTMIAPGGQTLNGHVTGGSLNTIK